MRNWWRLIIWAVLVAAALWFLWTVRAILPPFIAAVLFAAFMEPTIKRLRARGYSRTGAVLMVFCALFLSLAFFSILFGPPLVKQIAAFNKQVPAYVAQLQEMSENLVPSDEALQARQKLLDAVGLPHTRAELFDQAIKPSVDAVGKHVAGFFQGLLTQLSKVLAWVFMILITPLLTFVLMLDYDTMRRRTVRLIPLSIRGASVNLLEEIGDVFTNYLKGLLLTSAMFAVTLSALFWFLGLPAPLLLGFLGGAVYMAPWVGAILTMSVAVLVALASPGDAWFVQATGQGWQIVGIIAGYIALNALFDNVINPRITGKAVGLNFFMAFFAITAGAALFGIVGMILAYPLAGSVKVVLDRIFSAVIEDRARRKLRLPRVPLRFRVKSEPVSTGPGFIRM
jgi:predicted PurR-regulated permease PerM